MAAGGGALRLTRVAVFALCAVVLACGAHLMGGGVVAAPVALLAVPPVMLVANLLATRRRGLHTLLPMMGSLQFVLHELFTITSNAQNCRVAGAAGVMPGMSGGGAGHLAMNCDAGMDRAMAGGVHSMSLMLSMHALATILLVLLLARGEAAAWSVASWLVFRVLPLADLPQIPVLARFVIWKQPVVQLVSAPHRRTIQRRGPPIPVCAVV